MGYFTRGLMNRLFSFYDNAVMESFLKPLITISSPLSLQLGWVGIKI
jgi:hypothetical protein